jgi:hypothetical protein
MSEIRELNIREVKFVAKEAEITYHEAPPDIII